MVFFGGPAGALVSTQEYAGATEVFADNPQINLLSTEPIATNWDPAQAQQAMAGLLSRRRQDRRGHRGLRRIGVGRHPRVRGGGHHAAADHHDR